MTAPFIRGPGSVVPGSPRNGWGDFVPTRKARPRAQNPADWPKMDELALAETPPSRRRSQRRSALRDCFYHWFCELEARGEETTFRLGQVSGHETPVWTCLPHHSFDGLGGLYHVLAARYGRQLELPVLPGPYPGALARSLAALRVLAARAPKLLSFRRETPTRAGDRPIAVWSLFTQAQTSELRAQARAQETSLTALMLAALTAAIRPLLAGGTGMVNWVVPVNMRGVEADLAPTDNQAATLDIAFPATATATVIDAELREKRRKNMHWGVWQLLKWLGWAGPALVRFVARQELGVRKHGSFSNMGDVRLAGNAAEPSREPEWWLALNPVQRPRPLGAACLSYEGRLGLTLQIHPVLGLDQAAAQQVMDAWARALHQRPSTDSRSTAGTSTLPPGFGGVNTT